MCLIPDLPMFQSLRPFPLVIVLAGALLAPAAHAAELGSPSTPVATTTHVADRWFLEADDPPVTDASTQRHVVDRWFDEGDGPSGMQD